MNMGQNKEMMSVCYDTLVLLPTLLQLLSNLTGDCFMSSYVDPYAAHKWWLDIGGILCL